MSPKMKYYREGLAAKRNGIHWSDCPYPNWSEEFEWWHEGYYDAAVERLT